MAGITNRLSRIEQQINQAARRCPTCAEWPEIRTTFSKWHEPGPKPEPSPACCPDCGWEPVTLAVIYDQPQAAVSA